MQNEEIPLDNLGFSIRALTCLNRAGILTISDLKKQSMNDLIHIKNFRMKILRYYLMKF